MNTPWAEEWLEREDTVAREGRLARLNWIAAHMPDVDWMVFGCGPISKYVFEEARYCYVYGQFLASIMLGLAFVEMSLAGAFYGAGRNDLQRAGISELSREALRYGWLTQADHDILERVRRLRNPVTHFRPPADAERVEVRAFRQQCSHDYEVIESDAREVMQAVFHLFTKVVPIAYNEHTAPHIGPGKG
jgi:hypothetical protein